MHCSHLCSEKTRYLQVWNPHMLASQESPFGSAQSLHVWNVQLWVDISLSDHGWDVVCIGCWLQNGLFDQTSIWPNWALIPSLFCQYWYQNFPVAQLFLWTAIAEVLVSDVQARRSLCTTLARQFYEHTLWTLFYGHYRQPQHTNKTRALDLRYLAL